MGQSVVENIIYWYLIMTIVNNQKMASSKENYVPENKYETVNQELAVRDNKVKEVTISNFIINKKDANNNTIRFDAFQKCCGIFDLSVDGTDPFRHNKKVFNIVNNNKNKEFIEICPDPKEGRITFAMERNSELQTGVGQNRRRIRHQHGQRKRTFASGNCTSVVAQQGGTAVLHCEVHDITENTVTWIRRSDRALLSVGLIAFSADTRIYAAHRRHAKDWALHIRFVTPDDEGYYECQVPTHPPVSLFYKLKVVEAYAVILGEDEKIVQQGSVLRLSCEVRAATDPPTHIFWYFRHRMLNYELEGVSVWVRGARSELTVRAARAENDGRYTCAPHNARAAHVWVHVQPGESPAAIQHGIASDMASSIRPGNISVAVFILCTFATLL